MNSRRRDRETNNMTGLFSVHNASGMLSLSLSLRVSSRWWSCSEDVKRIMLIISWTLPQLVPCAAELSPCTAEEALIKRSIN